MNVFCDFRKWEGGSYAVPVASAVDTMIVRGSREFGETHLTPRCRVKHLVRQPATSDIIKQSHRQGFG